MSQIMLINFDFDIHFEITIDEKFENNGKRVAFKANIFGHGNQVSNATHENINEYIVMLSKNFIKVMRRLDGRPDNIDSSNVKENQQQN